MKTRSFQQSHAEAELGQQVRTAADPLCENFVNDIRAVSNALSHLTSELELNEDRRNSEFLELCCWVIDRKADEIEAALDAILRASFTGSATP